MFQFLRLSLCFFHSLSREQPEYAGKNPSIYIQTWDDLVSKFINQFFPPSKTTNLRNEITRFQQRFDESFYEAWDRFNDLLRACPHHGFSELHQLDTFYNALNINDQDSLNSAAGGNFLDKMPRECLKIIESKSKVRQTRAKAVVAKVSTNSSTQAVSSDVAELKDIVRALLLDKKNQASAPAPAPAPVKAVELSCVTCGGAHSHQNCPATHGNVYRDNISEYVSQAAAANYNQVSFVRILRLREVARVTARIALEFAPEFVYVYRLDFVEFMHFNVSLLLKPLCCDDIHDVTPDVSALAGCDI
ncbi:reverse transcriptase domain-containing protein [Tanacetum coccineum]